MVDIRDHNRAFPLYSTIRRLGVFSATSYLIAAFLFLARPAIFSVTVFAIVWMALRLCLRCEERKRRRRRRTVGQAIEMWRGDRGFHNMASEQNSTRGRSSLSGGLTHRRELETVKDEAFYLKKRNKRLQAAAGRTVSRQDASPKKLRFFNRRRFFSFL